MASYIEERPTNGAYNLSKAEKNLTSQTSKPLNRVKSTLSEQLLHDDGIYKLNCTIKDIASKQQETLQLNQCHLACLNAVLDQPVENWSDLAAVENQPLVYKALMVADVFLAQSLRIQAYAVDETACAATLAACQSVLVNALQ